MFTINFSFFTILCIFFARVGPNSAHSLYLRIFTKELIPTRTKYSDIELAVLYSLFDKNTSKLY